MALQGTIDAFPLVDVVQLLGSSRKTGRLTVDGDRGTGRVWVVDGALVAAEHRGAAVDDPVVALFELLRPSHGSFVFEPGEPAPDRGLGPVPLQDLLERAGDLLEEWRSVEAVVPSGAHRPVLVADLVADEVTLDRDRWRLVVAVAGAPSVAELGAALGLDELSLGRELVDLVSTGLVRIDEPEDPVVDVVVTEVAGADVAGADVAEVDPPDLPGTGDVEPVEGSAATGEVVDPSDLLGEGAAAEPFPDRFPIDDLVGAEPGDEDPWSAFQSDEDRFAAAQAFADPDAPVVLPPVGDAGWDRAFSAPADAGELGAFADPDTTPAFGAPAAFDSTAAFDAPAFLDPSVDAPAFDGSAPGPASYTDQAFAPAEPPVEDQLEVGDDPDDVDGTDEILRQMSRLSPKAAEAIAAALGTAAEATDDADAATPED